MNLRLGTAFILGLAAAGLLVATQVLLLDRTDRLWMPALIGFVAGFGGYILRRIDK